MTQSRIRARGVEPWHQKHWDWKAAGNFLTGGVGPGLFAGAAFAAVTVGPSAVLGLLAIALVGVGLLLVLMKIGRPLRAISVLRQPQRSWMSREAWVAIVFFPMALAAVWTGMTALWLVAAALALMFLFCQGMILREAKGIPAWRQHGIVPLIVTTGLTEGAGIFLAACIVLPALAPLARSAAAVTVVLAAARALAWAGYRSTLARDGAPTKALAVLDGYRSRLLVGGLVVPITCVILGMLVHDLTAPLFVVAGVAAAVTGLGFKFLLITRAGYNQGFALLHTPVRGTGRAGPPVKPGWTLP